MSLKNIYISSVTDSHLEIYHNAVKNLNDEKRGKYPCQDILNPMRIFTMLPSF
jgi:hypothetical protein